MARKQSDVGVERVLSHLETLTETGLRAEWRRLYGTEPPRRLGLAILRGGIAYRIQEQAEGGLKPALLRRLREAVDQGTGGRVSTAPVAPKPGTRLIREWQGRVHEVTVIDRGFVWQGKLYTSLSAIARTITGARWSGPRFFGLNAAGREVRNGQA